MEFCYSIAEFIGSLEAQARMMTTARGYQAFEALVEV